MYCLLLFDKLELFDLFLFGLWADIIVASYSESDDIPAHDLAHIYTDLTKMVSKPLTFFLEHDKKLVTVDSSIFFF